MAAVSTFAESSAFEAVPASERPDLLAPAVAAAIGAVPGALVFAIDPDLADTEALCAAYDLPLLDSVNCVVIRGIRGADERYAVCLTQATKRVDVNGLVRRRLEARRASFAPMAEAVARTGMEYGGITPIGMPPEWPIWVDSQAVDRDLVCIGSGLRRSKLLVPGHALAALPGAEVVTDLAREAPQPPPS